MSSSDLRCAANGAGVGRLALVGAVGLLCDSACIPNVLVGNGQVFNVLGYAAGFAGAVNAASVLAGGGGGPFLPVVADGCNGLRLGLVADGAGVQLLPASVQVAALVTTPSFHLWSSVTGRPLTCWVSPQRWQMFSTLPHPCRSPGW